MLKIQGTAQTMPTYVTCGPNEAIIVSGCCRSSPTIRAGGRVFVWPAFHKVQRLSLNTMTLHIESAKVYSDGGIPLTVKGIAQVKIQGKNLENLRAASEMFLDKTSDEISSIAKSVLDGHQRSMIASMDVESIYKNRHEFSKNVQQNAQTDLIDMGLTLISYTVQDISDEDGYLQALGQERIVRIQTDAKKEEAIQTKVSDLKSCEAEQAKKLKETEDNQILALKQLEFDLKKAEYKKKLAESDARKYLIGRLQSAETNKKIVDETMKIKLMEVDKQVELMQKQKELKELELTQSIECRADFDCFREKRLAQAYKEKAIAEADLEAAKIKQLAEAKAEAVRLQKEAEAEVLKEKAQAFAQFNDAAKLEMVLAVLPRLAAEVAGPIAECKKITSVSQDDGSVGFSRVTDEVFLIVERLCQSVSLMTATTNLQSNPAIRHRQDPQASGSISPAPTITSPKASVGSLFESRMSDKLRMKR